MGLLDDRDRVNVDAQTVGDDCVAGFVLGSDQALALTLLGEVLGVFS